MSAPVLLVEQAKNTACPFSLENAAGWKSCFTERCMAWQPVIADRHGRPRGFCLRLERPDPVDLAALVREHAAELVQHMSYRFPGLGQ